jgi:hypothetical protein
MTPTQRALKHLRSLGYQAQVVEKWNAFAKIRVDLFGCIDIVAVRPGVPVLGVQCTSHGHLAERVKKSMELGQPWLATGHAQLECWAFRKLKGQRELQLDRRVIPRIDQGFVDAMNR